MKYQRTERFNRNFDKLPEAIQDKAVAAIEKFMGDPKYPSLRVKKMKGYEGIWEGRLDRAYRFTFEYDRDEDDGEVICRFRNIGAHDILDKAP